MPEHRMVHVIDDDEAVRDSLRLLLDASGFVVQTYDSAVSFLDETDGAVEGCIVTDLRMPGMNGLELVAALNARRAAAAVIVITGQGDVPLAVQAMRAGVVDFIEKPFDDDAILRALDAVFDHSAPGGNGEDRQIANRLEALSMREQQVLDGLVAGKPNKVIAHDLGISPRTVEVYRSNVMTKMHAASLSELVRLALVGGRSR